MLSLILALLWLVAANLIGMLPSRDHHWRAAYALISLGLPLLIWVFHTNGTLWTLALLAAAASILRWPLYFAWKWVRGMIVTASQ